MIPQGLWALRFLRLNITAIIRFPGCGLRFLCPRHIPQKIYVDIHDRLVQFDRDLLPQLQLGQEIPIELYQAIVDIYIYFLGYVPWAKESEAAAGEADDGSDVQAEEA